MKKPANDPPNETGVPFARLTPTPEERSRIYTASIERVLDSGWFILGPEVKAFECEFAEFTGAAHAVGVGNGTDAIALALMASGIGEGDEVITSPMTATFTALGISQAGAIPVFADVEPDRLCLTEPSVASVATDKTKAVVPVHLYGHPMDLAPINDLAERRGWVVIEDACQAHGARREGRCAGSVSKAGAFSFYPTKNLGALGDGGMVVSSDDELAEKIRRLRNGGQTSRYLHTELGMNSRLDEVQAAILRSKLPTLDQDNQKRRELAARYVLGLEGLPLRIVRPDPEAESAWHLFVVRSEARDELAEHLKARGIDTLIHYPIPSHRQPAYPSEAACPQAEQASSEVLSLPLFPTLTKHEQDRVIHAVRAFFDR